MDELASTLVSRFNLKAKYIRKNKYMYICNTNNGIKIIKPVNYAPDKILFIHNIKKHLIEQGFDKIDNYYMSVENLPYVINENIVYTMTDYIDLDELDFSNYTDTKKSIELLAAFHKYSQGCVKYNNDTKWEFSDIKDLYNKKLENLIRIKKSISKQKKLTDFELKFTKTYDYFFKSACDTLNLLEKYKYKNLDSIAQKNIMICHNKIKEENFKIGKKSYIVNMEDISINHFVYDLASLIIRYIKKHPEEYISIEEMLNTYSKINYIDVNILPVLYALVKFPNKYIETCENFMKRKRNFTPISIISDLEDIINLRNFQEDYISKIKY